MPPGFRVTGSARERIRSASAASITSPRTCACCGRGSTSCATHLGFEPYWKVAFHTNDLRPDLKTGTGLRSIVMWEPFSGLKFANNEPLRPHFEKSQIAIFCSDNHGPGVQHVALSRCPISVRASPTLRRRSIEFLRTPGTYYDALPSVCGARACHRCEPMAELRKLGIQVDGNHEGYLLQIFMKDASLYYQDPAAGRSSWS